MPFNVGDRVRCVDPRDNLPEGEYIISHKNRSAVYGDQYFYNVGFDISPEEYFGEYRFRLVEPEREEHVGYYVVYRDPSDGQLIPVAFPTERDANIDISDMNDEHGWTVVAKKKIKTRI